MIIYGWPNHIRDAYGILEGRARDVSINNLSCTGGFSEVSIFFRDSGVRATLYSMHNKQHHRKVLPRRFQLNDHNLGFDRQPQKPENHLVQFQ